MKPSLMLGLLSALCWGLYIFVSKLVTNSQYYGIEPRRASLLMLVGIAACFVGYALFAPPGTRPLSPPAVGLGIGAGVLWALGMVFSFLALASGVSVARLVPLYNTNTLVAVLLGIIFLKEARSGADLVHILVGAALIVAGGVLVSR